MDRPEEPRAKALTDFLHRYRLAHTHNEACEAGIRCPNLNFAQVLIDHPELAVALNKHFKKQRTEAALNELPQLFEIDPCHDPSDPSSFPDVIPAGRSEEAIFFKKLDKFMCKLQGVGGKRKHEGEVSSEADSKSIISEPVDKDEKPPKRKKARAVSRAIKAEVSQIKRAPPRKKVSKTSLKIPEFFESNEVIVQPIAVICLVFPEALHASDRGRAKKMVKQRGGVNADDVVIEVNSTKALASATQIAFAQYKFELEAILRARRQTLPENLEYCMFGTSAQKKSPEGKARTAGGDVRTAGYEPILRRIFDDVPEAFRYVPVNRDAKKGPYFTFNYTLCLQSHRFREIATTFFPNVQLKPPEEYLSCVLTGRS